MKAAFLPDRGVVKIAGDDARGFLNNLVTSEIEVVTPGTARFGALLTPQGKIIADFLITEAPAGHGGGLLIDCPRELAQPLATKLGFYKLRAKVTVENLSDAFGVLAVWDGEPGMKPDLTFADPRNAELGYRILVPPDLVPKMFAVLKAQQAWEQARRFLSDPAYGLVVLDELNIALKYRYLDVHTVIADLLDRPEMQHVVVTGRGAPPELIAVADTVSEMNDVKHAFRAGIAAQAGTEW